MVTTDRLVVQTGKGETIIRRDDIEYLEAARNCVTVSTGKRDLLVRNTLARIVSTAGRGFRRRTSARVLAGNRPFREQCCF